MAGATALTNGEATVTTSAKQLTTDFARTVALFALSTNSGTTYVGGTGVTTANGYPLAAGGALSLDVSDAGSVYIVGTNGDKIRWIAIGA